MKPAARFRSRLRIVGPVHEEPQNPLAEGGFRPASRRPNQHAIGVSLRDEIGEFVKRANAPLRAHDYCSTVSIFQSIHMPFHALTGC